MNTNKLKKDLKNFLLNYQNQFELNSIMDLFESLLFQFKSKNRNFEEFNGKFVQIL